MEVFLRRFVDCRIVFKYAIQYSASALVLCHNHPSGTNAPSKEDKMITDKIREGAKLFDIAVLDHIIISGESYFSFADQKFIVELYGTGLYRKIYSSRKVHL